MAKWPKDTQAARNAFYGDPGRGEIARQMVPVVPPFAMYYDRKRVKVIQFHRKAAPALLAALNEIWDYYEHDQKKIDAVGVSKYAGAYNHRMVRGSDTKWSNHAYAAAIDLNAEQNGLYAKGNIPQPVIDAFTRQGFMWGGWYKGRKDPMHFEAVDNGGRVPGSPRPTWPRPVAVGLLDTSAAIAPADELGEAQPLEPAPADELVAPGAAATANVDAPAPAEVNEKLSNEINRPVIVSTLEVREDVRIVQNQLRLKGFYAVGMADGKLGEDTKDAIMAFRRRNGLPVSTDIDDELMAALATSDKKPVSEKRAIANAEVVAQVAPEVVPVKQGYFAAKWGALVTGFWALYNALSDKIASAWDFFTDHKDNLPSDPGLLKTAWGYVAAVPSSIWIALGAVGLTYLAIKGASAVKQIKQSVQSGARQ